MANKAQNIILSALIGAVVPFSQMTTSFPSSIAASESSPTHTESTVTPTPDPEKLNRLVWTAKPGETLKSVAASYYGDEAYWTTVWNDNSWVTNPDSLPFDATIYVRKDHPDYPEELTATLSQRLLHPKAMAASERSISVMNTSSNYGGITWSMPLPYYGYISTRYSYSHPGIDLTDPVGTPIYAASDGTVIESGWSRVGYGNTIVVAHDNGYWTRYAHLSSIEVSRGQYVNRGAEIGRVGCTGHCTGPHLHFEFHQGGSPLSPHTILSLR